MLDPVRLRALLAISEHGGIPAAARALSSSAVDVHEQVTELERSLGVTLVDGDRLTPAGQRVADSGGRALAALAEVSAAASAAGGTLRVGVEPAAGRALLPEALPALAGLSLLVEPLGAGLGSQDLAVVAAYEASVPRRPEPAVERRELLTEPLLLAVPAAHRLAGRSSGVRLADLADERWVAGDGDGLVAFERAAAAAGFEPVVSARVAEDSLALTLVAAGHGVALVPASAVPARVDGVRLLPLVDAGLRRTVSVLVRRRTAGDAAVRRVVDALGTAARRVAAAVPGVSAAGTVTPAPVNGTHEPPLRREAVNGLPESNGNGRHAPGTNGSRPDPLSDPLPSDPHSRDRGDTLAERSFTPDPPREPSRPADPPSPFAADGPREPSSPFAADPPSPSPFSAEPSSPFAAAPSREPASPFAGEPSPPAAESAPLGGEAPRHSRQPESPRSAPEPASPFAADLSRPSEAPGLPRRGRGELPRPFEAPPGSDLPTPAEAPSGGLPRRGRGELPRPFEAPPEPGSPFAGGGELPRRERERAPNELPPPGELPRTDTPAPRRPDPWANRRRPGDQWESRPPRPRPAEPAPDSPPYPTSPDLGVRSLTSAELGVRRPNGSPANGSTALPRRGRQEALDTLPPAPGGTEDVRLSIFEELQSEWFTRRDEPGTPAGRTPWDSPADDGWKAAARLAEPTTAGTTTAGLPRRKPQALYVPGTANGEERPATPVTRSATEVRGRLSSYRDGVRRGRHAERPADE